MTNAAPKQEIVKSRMSEVRALLTRYKGAISEVLPKHVTPERIMRVALNAVVRQPVLLECDGTSLVRAVVEAAALGLEPSGTLGSGYLVPFKDNKTNTLKVQFIAGYRGLIDLARRSGAIQGIEARLVYEGEDFEIRFGTEGSIRHSPRLDGTEDDAKIVAAYAVAHFKDGTRPQFEAMSRVQVEKIRAKSKAKDTGPWVSDFGEMARKTVVRRLCKYLPLSVELASMLEREEDLEAGRTPAPVIDLPLEENGGGAAAAPVNGTTGSGVAAAKAKVRAALPPPAEAAATVTQTDEGAPKRDLVLDGGGA